MAVICRPGFEISDAVANGESCRITCPYSSVTFEWPRKVIVFGVKGSSVTWLPTQRFLGYRHHHWNLNWELPVSYLGSYLYFIN